MLAQNYPNPFNPSTTIEFTIQTGTRGSLEIYSIQGRLVRTLLSGYLAPNHYTLVWDGKDQTGLRVPSGVYLYTLTHGFQRETRRMVLLK